MFPCLICKLTLTGRYEVVRDHVDGHREPDSPITGHRTGDCHILRGGAGGEVRGGAGAEL